MTNDPESGARPPAKSKVWPLRRPIRLAVLISGGGTTMQNLIDRIADGRLNAEIAVVISDRIEAFGLQRAQKAGIHAVTIPGKGKTPAALGDETFAICRRCHVDLVVMGGYLRLIEIPADFLGRVINIHPSLIPAFCGKGFHGRKVHEAVLERGCKITGCTVHLVDNEYDHGPILLQRPVPVLEGDTPEKLAARVFEAECSALPDAIEAFQAKVDGS